MPIHETEVKKRFRVVGFDKHGNSFLFYATDDKKKAVSVFEKELAMVEPAYPGIDLIEIHRQAD